MNYNINHLYTRAGHYFELFQSNIKTDEKASEHYYRIHCRYARLIAWIKGEHNVCALAEIFLKTPDKKYSS